MNKFVRVMMAIGLAASSQARAADEYWRTDGTAGGTWASTYWNIGSANAAGGTGWTAGNNAVFTTNSSLTFASATVGNVIISPNQTVTITAGGLLTLGGVRTFDIGTGATLTWSSQSQGAGAGNEGAGIIKNGAGTLSWGAGPGNNARYDGGFTLNAGTVIVSGDYALGTNCTLALNGGTLQSSGTRAFTVNNVTVGGDFALAGTGNANWDQALAVGLGAATRTVTNNTTSGSRQFRGLISGNAGVGLAFTGTNGVSGAQIYLGNTGNTFNGPLTIKAGEVVFNGNGALGSGTDITLDGGRLTMASMNAAGNTSALTAATIDSNKTVYVGDTAGTSISIQGATGVTTFNGVIADVSGKTGAWAKQGAGVLILGGVSTYSGTTAINNGTVQLALGNDRLPTGTVLSFGQAASANLGTLDLNGNQQQVAGLTSTAGTNATALKNMVTNSSPTPATLTLGGSGSYVYGNGSTSNSGVIAGALNIVVNGGGRQTLGGVNTYTGGTTVSNGTLVLTGAGTVGSGAIDLKHGALFDVSGTTAGRYTLSGGQRLDNLGTFTGGLIIDIGAMVSGGGSFNGAVTNGNGGFLTPGAGGDTNSFQSLTLAGGSTNSFYVEGVATRDMSVVSNGLSGAGSSPLLRLDLNSYTAEAGVIVLYVNLGASSFDGTSQYFALSDPGADNDGLALYNGTRFYALGSGGATNEFTISYDYNSDNQTFGTGNDIALTVIPEPGTMSLMVILGAAFWVCRRTRDRDLG